MHQNAEAGNENDENVGRGFVSTITIKNWIIIPLLCFHVAGFVTLVVLVFVFLGREHPQYYQFVWPALIIAFAGLPFAFASNVKTLVSALTTGN